MEYKQNKDFQALESTIASLERQIREIEQVQLQVLPLFFLLFTSPSK